MPKMYGPSDHQSMTIPHADGQVHTHKMHAPKSRHAAPGYGDTERTLPVVTTECADCVAALKQAGFNANPEMVAKTADEQEFEKRAAGEGTLMSRIMAESLGQALAKEATKNLNAR